MMYKLVLGQRKIFPNRKLCITLFFIQHSNVKGHYVFILFYLEINAFFHRLMDIHRNGNEVEAVK